MTETESKAIELGNEIFKLLGVEEVKIVINPPPGEPVGKRKAFYIVNVIQKIIRD